MSLFEQMAQVIREHNAKNILPKIAGLDSLIEPEAHTCEECQTYSSGGIEYASKYFCDEDCKHDYYAGVNDTKGHDLYDQARDNGLESY